MNAVIAAVAIMLVLSLCRVHVVVALIIGALAGGMSGGLGMDGSLEAFNKGLGGGATVALSYALLGAFAVAIAKSGLAHALADKALTLVGRQDERGGGALKWMLVGLLLAVAISSQNILPIHIAFIPLLVPPLLYVITRLQIDRRLIACVLTFGLITPYMFLPVGFGNIFLNEILLANVVRSGVDVTGVNVSHAMLIPAMGMVAGLHTDVGRKHERRPRLDRTGPGGVRQLESLAPAAGCLPLRPRQHPASGCTGRRPGDPLQPAGDAALCRDHHRAGPAVTGCAENQIVCTGFVGAALAGGALRKPYFVTEVAPGPNR